MSEEEVVENPSPVLQVRLGMFRLITGEDIITTFTMEQGGFMCQHPLKLVIRRLATGETGVLLVPWLPMEIIDPTTNMECIILARDIMTIMPVRDAMKSFYFEVSRIMAERIKRNDKKLDENLSQMSMMYAAQENRSLEEQILKDYEDRFGEIDGSDEGTMFH